jgi:hypothetical protein
MSGAAAMFSLLNVAAKALTGDFPVIELLWARTAGHLAFVVAAFGARPGRRLFATRNPVFQLARSILLLGSTAFNFVALRYTDLATAATINFTAPCIVALLAVPMLGERVGPPRWMAIGVGFLDPEGGPVRSCRTVRVGPGRRPPRPRGRNRSPRDRDPTLPDASSPPGRWPGPRWFREWT